MVFFFNVNKRQKWINEIDLKNMNLNFWFKFKTFLTPSGIGNLLSVLVRRNSCKRIRKSNSIPLWAIKQAGFGAMLRNWWTTCHSWKNLFFRWSSQRRSRFAGKNKFPKFIYFILAEISKNSFYIHIQGLVFSYSVQAYSFNSGFIWQV